MRTVAEYRGLLVLLARNAAAPHATNHEDWAVIEEMLNRIDCVRIDEPGVTYANQRVVGPQEVNVWHAERTAHAKKLGEEIHRRLEAEQKLARLLHAVLRTLRAVDGRMRSTVLDALYEAYVDAGGNSHLWPELEERDEPMEISGRVDFVRIDPWKDETVSPPVDVSPALVDHIVGLVIKRYDEVAAEEAATIVDQVADRVIERLDARAKAATPTVHGNRRPAEGECGWVDHSDMQPGLRRLCTAPNGHDGPHVEVGLIEYARCQEYGCDKAITSPDPNADGCVFHGDIRTCIVFGCTKAVAGDFNELCAEHGGKS